MSTETLAVEKREQIGTNAVRKLRREGKVPAILYGHGKSNEPLAVRRDALVRLLDSGVKLVKLQGGAKATALVRDVAWDAFGIEVLHVDFNRVSLKEMVEVEVPVKLRGEAPGVAEGGLLEFVTHSVTLECPAGEIPEELDVNVGDLHLGQAIHAGELALPEHAQLVSNEHDVIVQVSHPTAEEPEEVPAEGTEGEPEVVGGKRKTEEDEES
ncbi:MAG: 50S ribosomal protein L25 [Planctomycetota bacterium]|nr:MAG: 50S ribosomal protein L25 [Planctomycetota bacterium]